MEFFANFYGLLPSLAKTRVNELAELLGIAKQLDNKFQEYSTGTKQKMAIIRSLLNNPQVLFFDEPTKSLDPIAAQNLRTFIKEVLVAKQRKTVFFASHQIHEAEILSDRIAIIDKGHIKAYGTLEKLRKIISTPDASLYEIFTNLTKDT